MLPMLSHDKANHFVYGALAGAAGALLALLVLLALRLLGLQLHPLAVFAPAAAAALAAFVVGWGKEAHDRRTKRGVYDPRDAHVTFYGGLPVAAAAAAAACAALMP